VVCGRKFKEIDREDVVDPMVTSGICGKECLEKSREITRNSEKAKKKK
jgi:hypothetical protein